MPLGLSSALGAKGASDALTEILKQRFIAQQAKQQFGLQQQSQALAQRNSDLTAQNMSADNARQDEALNIQRQGAAASAQNLSETKATKAAQLVELKRIAADPSTPEPIRQLVTLQMGGANVNSVKDLESTPTKPEPAGSDFNQFLNRYASKVGKTVQTLTADDELAARKAYGQSDDRPQSTLGIIVQGPDGPLNVNRQTNTARPVTMDGAPVGKAATASEATDIAQIEQGLSILDELKSIKKDEWLGPLGGRLTQGRISMPGMDVPSDLAKFSAQTATLKNSVIKAITGAAMSAQEGERIMKQIPDFTDKPEVWDQKLLATEKNMMMMHDRTLQLTGVRGAKATPAKQTAQELTVSMADLEAIAKMKNTSVEQEKARATAAGYVIR